MAHLGIERVDLARDKLARLLGVGVVEEVLLDLLRLRHLRRQHLEERTHVDETMGCGLWGSGVMRSGGVTVRSRVVQ